MSPLSSFMLLLPVATVVQASSRSCQNLTLPVNIASRNAIFGNVAIPRTNLDATAFALSATRQGVNGTDLALTGYQTVQGTYNISAKFCTPSETTYSRSLQILTHGIGFDQTYWDLSYHGYNYSYTNVALAHGHATLAIDRLGIGKSTHGEPRDEIQSFLEVEALAEVTRLARQGDLPGLENREFARVFHIGHSFGSAQTYSLAAKYPDLTDGIVLTGFSMNASFVNLFTAGSDFQQANLNQPLRFGRAENALNLETILQQFQLIDYFAPLDVGTIVSDALNYPDGYLVNTNAASTNYLHFYPHYFDPMILYFAEATKQPVTIGELLTLLSIPAVNEYHGPVLVVTGQYDLPYCGGDCLATGGRAPSIPDGVRASFPNATSFTAHIQPDSGHGINFHYNSSGAYQYIQNWFAKEGRGASRGRM